MNQKQTEAIVKIGLSADRISQVERDTQWRFCQHTNGTDIRFQIKRVRGEYEFVIWLKKKITIGVYVYSRKQEWQKRFKEKIGAWAPQDTHPSDYTDQGTNPNKGHVGDWRSEIEAGHFLENIERIKGMVQSITKKLEETGIWKDLANGKPIVELGQGVVDEKEGNDYDEDEEGKDDDTRIESGMIKNLIVFGAPGTGKSHKLEENRKVFGDRYERVTFYPTYSYAQFVGTYKPVMQVVEAAMKSDGLSDDELSNLLKEDYNNAGGGSEKTKTAAVLLFAEKYYESLSKTSIPQIIKKAGLPESSYTAWLSTGMALARARAHNLAGKKESTIAYEFVPGPFLRVLVKALNDSQNDYCLVIEEINRANAAAVFGDVFQLLDRVVKDDADKNVKKDTSEYAIAASEDVKRYLGEALTDAGKNALLELTGSMDNLKMPANMYIWATMNSADQGVFPMDTAFKRRWEFDYIGIDDEARGDCLTWLIEGKGYKWNDIRRYINGLLAEHDVNEDKLMGPYFVKADGNHAISKKPFVSKVLMYLWEDAGRMIRRNLFGSQIKTYSQLVQEWDRNEGGVKVFDQCNKKENLPPDLKKLYAQWTKPTAAQEA